jgi:hypothetical protein
MTNMLTKRQKEILLGEKNSYYRKVLSYARRKALVSSKDLSFLSEIDPKTRVTVLEPMLLSGVKSCLEDEKIEFPQPKRIVGGKVSLKKGLPYNIKKKLKADGDGDIARLFDGKVMVQKAGILRNDDGSPRRMITYRQKLDFSYKMLQMIYEFLKEQSTLPSRYEPKVTLSYKDNEFNLELDYSSRTPKNQETS